MSEALSLWASLSCQMPEKSGAGGVAAFAFPQENDPTASIRNNEPGNFDSDMRRTSKGG
jgi:hypothetical protein